MPRLLPSVEAFRRAGWLPSSQTAYNHWMSDIQRTISSRTQQEFIAPIKEFQTFIETNPTVFVEFNRMFEGQTESPKDYMELLGLFNTIFRQAPYYGDLGPPVYMIMARVMNTQGGFSAFTKQNLNAHFKKLFETWATFISSADSRYVLVKDKFDDKHYGWFSDKAEAALLAQYAEGRTFEQVFICDACQPYYGYTSFDDFFNRKFREPEVDRPVGGGVENLQFISAATESVVYHVQENVQRSDALFIKDEAYSLVHLLANDPLLEQFVGGKIIQGFLNVTGYHRWHAPVNGTITKIVDIPGTYFAQAPGTIAKSTSFDSEIKELPPYLQSLTFFANTAARKLMFIQADNNDIGLMCFIAIGMTEISTCESTVYEGQHLKRGDELGMFHFGGSSSALLFNKNAAPKVHIDGKFTKPDAVMKINEAIAAVV